MPAPTILDVRVIAGSGGGPDKTILHQPRFLTPHYRNPIAYLRPPGDPGFDSVRSRAAQVGATLLEVDDRGPLDWRIVPRFLEICRREQVAIWHGHDYKSNLLGLLLRPFWPMKLVTTVHGWVHHTKKTPVYYAIDRLCLRYYESVVCVSDDLYRICRQAGVSSRRCQVIENGIDLQRYTRQLTTTQAKARLGFATDRLLIGAVGRLSAEKGFALLLRAVQQLIARGYPLDLVIAGAGDEQTALERQIEQTGLSNHLRLLGFREDTWDLYQAFDVFALSSLREGLPNVLLEAMALEVPVVATRIAGIPRLIDDRVNGLLIEPGDETALVSALELLCNDADLRAHLARAGRQTIEQSYSFTERMNRLRALYDGLLRRSGSTHLPC